MQSDNQVSNPLLQRIQLPGETFALPSGGLFYDSDVFDETVENAEVHVHPMTTIDEIMLKTPDMLFSGDAVRKVFARCIPQIKNVDGLLAKDIDFLLTCVRKVSYGPDLQIDYRHKCDNAKTHTYTISVDKFIKETKKIDPTTIQQEFVAQMPNGQSVMLQPMTFKNFVQLMQASNDRDLNVTKTTNSVIQSLVSVIKQVDEVTDKKMISEWVSQIPPSFIRKINEQIDNTMNWGPEFDANVICKDCGEEVTMDTPLNPLTFFI